MEQTKFLLDESQLPRRWYNVAADMPSPPQPVLHPGTGQPVGPDDLAPLFPMELTFDPPWTPDKMSDDAKFILGFG